MSRQWMRLDNAALIFPAIKRAEWVNVFRVAATLSEDVDPVSLQKAVDNLKPRFPSVYVRLGSGVFWYFLEEVRDAPKVRQDYAWPLTHMGARELRSCCFRVLYYRRRIAVEFFHALTDGSGGMIFLKTLTAEYLRIRYGIDIPASDGVLDITEPPRDSELEDSFQRFSGKHSMSRAESNSWRLSGTREPNGRLHLTIGTVDTGRLLHISHEFGGTVTAFISAVMAEAIISMQNEKVPPSKRKPVKITIPVNLRRIFPSDTLRNFALTVNPGVDPKLGDYTLEELCREFSHQLILEAAPQRMAGRIAANVNPQKFPALRLAPLFIKNVAMRIVYDTVGETKGCLNISNLGAVSVPEVMRRYISRLEFIIGVQYSYPNNCSIASFGSQTCISMIRNIEEPELERRFFSRLVELGIPVAIESNDTSESR
jgi:hypothetical protein